MMTLAAGLFGAVLLGSVLDLALEDEEEDDLADDEGSDPAAECPEGDLLDLTAGAQDGDVFAGAGPEDDAEGGWLAGADDAALRDYLDHNGETDSFVFGPNPDGPAPMITGFDAAAGRLVLSYDPAAGAEPSIAVAPDPADPGNVIVFADGLAVGLVRGGAGVTAAMIAREPVLAAAA